MINLDDNVKDIEKFIQNSIEKFCVKKGIPTSIGIYCCPSSGWISTNFNLTKTLLETENNCADFQYVEFDFFELSTWEEEYENKILVFKIEDNIIEHNHDNGDENLNEIIFNFLIPIIKNLKKDRDSIYLLQMLDSEYVKVL